MTAARKPTSVGTSTLMVVNDVPGEECRIAMLQEGRLDDLFAERAATATSVGNIYKGRVTNVEQAIQAAFIDFGHAQKGFLHYSDLHPRYFPGGDKTEKVGKKTARRERPPLQKCLKKGDEILVQVIKEGIGTKGPTLTSYLSIPGRLMVMMPHMDKVGVTRRVEDDGERKAMRAVLDKLELPENFGFIVRTAGMGQSQTELKRDVAYLTRLWKVMEKRINTAGAPCELYTESDLVLRTIRDNLRPDIEAIMVDSEAAYDRIVAFLRVVAPRSSPPVVHYRRTMPIFHAFEVERQIEMIHSREVPLPSGGALVIDQTEALVAIDVNSGRSRKSRDAESNAFNTNMEAAEEIARQLRLRDLGGIIVNDFIDMRQHKNRREVLARFTESLKRDRARTSVLPISDLGLLEMTRQRMRPSLRMANYVECQSCSGQGELKSSDAVANDILREIGFLLHCSETDRVEVAVAPRVASSLLSTRRRMLDAIEQRMGKEVDVRIIESFAGDRVEYYAYDARGADLDLDALTPSAKPVLADLQAEMDLSEEDLQSEVEKKAHGRRRRRRSSKAPAADATAIALSEDFARELDEIEAQALREEKAEAAAKAAGKVSPDTSEKASGDSDGDASGSEESTGGRKKRRRRRRGRRLRTIEPLINEPSRLHVLAKLMGITSKEILAKYIDAGGEEATGFAIKSHASSVTLEQAVIIQGWFAPAPPEPTAETSSDEGKVATSQGEESTTEEGGTKKRRRRRRGGRGRRRRGPGDGAESTDTAAAGAESAEASATSDEVSPEPATEASGTEAEARNPRTRNRRVRKKAANKTDTSGSDRDAGGERAEAPRADAAVEEKPAAKPKRRSLYGSRRKISPGEVAVAKAKDA